MNKSYILLVVGFFVLFFDTTLAHGRQLLICPGRKATVHAQVPQSAKRCPFCDEEILSKNFIVSEDYDNDVRIMMNRFPYGDFCQVHHILIMPISHKLSYSEFSQKELQAQVDVARYVSEQLYDDSYSQEYLTNLGEGGGQSVPHLHNHQLIFVLPPLSLPDLIKTKVASSVNSIEGAFELVKTKLISQKNTQKTLSQSACANENCYYCSIINNQENDDENFVIGRFKHNVICLAHFPNIAAQVIVVPYNHCHALKDLSSEQLLENMTLSLYLLPKLKMYVQERVRQWKGDNIFTKSVGGKSSDEEKNDYHLYTSIMPRTVISSPSGTIDGNSCKLDFDPEDLFWYLKEFYDELQQVSECGWMSDQMQD